MKLKTADACFFFSAHKQLQMAFWCQGTLLECLWMPTILEIG